MKDTTTILDQYGNPIQLKQLREQQSHATTRAIRSEMDSHPSSGLTPLRIFHILQSAEQGDLVPLQDLADDMLERDGAIYNALHQRTSGVSKLNVQVVPPKNASAAEIEQASTVQAILEDGGVDLQALVKGCMDGVLKGFAAHAQWWQMEGKLLVPRHEYVAQRCFTVRNMWITPTDAIPTRYGQAADARNELRLRTQSTPDGEPLTPYNWLIHRHPARSGYLAKQALARVLVWPFLLKHYALRDFAEFLEIHGLPLRLGTYAAGSSDTDRSALLRAVTEIGHSAAGIIPSGMSIDFKDAPRGDANAHMRMVEYQDSIIAKVLLGQTLTSGEGRHGTQALGNVHADVRDDILQDDASLVAASMTRDMLWPFVQFNVPGADFRRLPRLAIYDEKYQDIKDLSTSLPALVKMGAQVPVSWLHQETGIPMAKKGEAVLQDTPAMPALPAPGVAPATPAATSAALAAQLRQVIAALAATPLGGKTALDRAIPQDDIDLLVQDALGDWQPVMQPLMQPMLDEIDALQEGDATGLQSLLDRLPDLLTRMDATQLSALLTQVGAIAHLAGSAGVPNGADLVD